MVDLEVIDNQGDADELRQLITRHFQNTGSRKAESILSDWEMNVPLFIKVFPMEYRRALGLMSKEDEATTREEVVNG
jgi:glutamate synthase domain-containing protein 3